MMVMNYKIDQHATAFPSNIVAGSTYGGHMFNILLNSDTDNGNIVKVGDWESLDLFKEAAATEIDVTVVEKMANGNFLCLVNDPKDCIFIYNVPIGAEQYNNAFKKESNLYNEKGSIARGYELKKYDRFEVSAAGFNVTPTVGMNITTITNKKLG